MFRRVSSFKPVIVLDIFETDLCDIYKVQKWFTETSQLITVTGQILHGHLYYY